MLCIQTILYHLISEHHSYVHVDRKTIVFVIPKGFCYSPLLSLVVKFNPLLKENSPGSYFVFLLRSHLLTHLFCMGMSSLCRLSLFSFVLFHLLLLRTVCVCMCVCAFMHVSGGKGVHGCVSVCACVCVDICMWSRGKGVAWVCLRERQRLCMGTNK